MYSESIRVYGKYFCIFAKNGLGRIGIVVGKKVSKKAVDRNFVKRRVRYLFRTNKDLFSNMDTLLVALPPSLSAEYKDILEDVKKTIEKISHRLD